MRLTPEVYLVGGGNFGFTLSDAFDSHIYVVDGGGVLAMIDAGTGFGEEEIIGPLFGPERTEIVHYRSGRSFAQFGPSPTKLG